MQSPQTGLGLLGASPPLLIKADRYARGHEGGDVYTTGDSGLLQLPFQGLNCIHPFSGKEGSSGCVTVPHFIDETLRLGRLYDLTDDTAVTRPKLCVNPHPPLPSGGPRAFCVRSEETGDSVESPVSRKRVTSELFRQ